MGLRIHPLHRSVGIVRLPRYFQGQGGLDEVAARLPA
jgi:hypothetical protein